MAKTIKVGTLILHSEADEVIPFAESRELLWACGLPESALVDLGNDHRLADLEPLQIMLEASERVPVGWKGDGQEYQNDTWTCI